MQPGVMSSVSLCIKQKGEEGEREGGGEERGRGGRRKGEGLRGEEEERGRGTDEKVEWNGRTRGWEDLSRLL